MLHILTVDKFWVKNISTHAHLSLSMLLCAHFITAHISLSNVKMCAISLIQFAQFLLLNGIYQRVVKYSVVFSKYFFNNFIL